MVSRVRAETDTFESDHAARGRQPPGIDDHLAKIRGHHLGQLARVLESLNQRLHGALANLIMQLVELGSFPKMGN